MMKKSGFPRHVAIIMDGNGRWARKRGLPRILGHRAGMKSVKRVIKSASEMGLEYLTLYAFSTENWKRPAKEVSALMSLLKEYIQIEGENLKKNNIRVNVLGDISKVPADSRAAIEKIVSETAANSGLSLNIALNYGGRQEILRAVNNIIKDGLCNVDDKTFSNYLYTRGMPDPDLLIRTSGEYRISNFLLWQMAYTEIYITKTLWPDFDKKELLKALDNFSSRQRRFGGI